ncbi:hypothetical protein [Streptomyces lancefieldiae]|uniref:Uncharacterized protein n=1 Tax=Streptomyces lancefieldiae TaxID=3075520 RepID=A0ABU3ARD1_9ACTN|nr:hypothetical protein [Streptomyces sp. DSM 40712]MDT0612744.1 hypothetical protein [Streptomyces sp. DSM 40712]
MATTSQSTAADRGADPLTRGLLERLALSDRPDEAALAPDLPWPRLLAVLSAYHRREVRVGFPELTSDRL